LYICAPQKFYTCAAAEPVSAPTSHPNPVLSLTLHAHLDVRTPALRTTVSAPMLSLCCASARRPATQGCARAWVVGCIRSCGCLPAWLHDNRRGSICVCNALHLSSKLCNKQLPSAASQRAAASAVTDSTAALRPLDGRESACHSGCHDALVKRRLLVALCGRARAAPAAPSSCRRSGKHVPLRMPECSGKRPLRVALCGRAGRGPAGTFILQ